MQSRIRESKAVCSRGWPRIDKVLLPPKMFFFGLVLLGLGLVGVGAIELEREDRSLVNSFPFNGIDAELPERDSRQGSESASVPFSDVASSYAGGKR